MAFVPSSLILANHFLPLNEALGIHRALVQLENSKVKFKAFFEVAILTMFIALAGSSLLNLLNPFVTKLIALALILAMFSVVLVFGFVYKQAYFSSVHLKAVKSFYLVHQLLFIVLILLALFALVRHLYT